MMIMKKLYLLNKCRINDPVENNSIEENFNNILKITKREKSIQYEMDGIKKWIENYTRKINTTIDFMQELNIYIS